MKNKIIIFTLIICSLLIITNFSVASIPIPRGFYYRLIPQKNRLNINPEFGVNYSNPLENVSSIPQHPFMASNGWSNMHCDSYMSDVNFQIGPLGKNPTVTSTLRGIAECVTICHTSFPDRYSSVSSTPRPGPAMRSCRPENFYEVTGASW